MVNKGCSMGVFCLMLPLLLGILACGKSPKYADLVGILDRELAASQAYVAAIEKATDAAQAARAISAYAAALHENQLAFRQALRAWPELVDSHDPPAELRGAVERLNALAPQVDASFGKLSAWQNDSAVIAASQELIAAQNEQFEGQPR